MPTNEYNIIDPDEQEYNIIDPDEPKAPVPPKEESILTKIANIKLPMSSVARPEMMGIVEPEVSGTAGVSPIDVTKGAQFVPYAGGLGKAGEQLLSGETLDWKEIAKAQAYSMPQTAPAMMIGEVGTKLAKGEDVGKLELGLAALSTLGVPAQAIAAPRMALSAGRKGVELGKKALGMGGVAQETTKDIQALIKAAESGQAIVDPKKLQQFNKALSEISRKSIGREAAPFEQLHYAGAPGIGSPEQKLRAIAVETDPAEFKKELQHVKDLADILKTYKKGTDLEQVGKEIVEPISKLRSTAGARIGEMKKIGKDFAPIWKEDLKFDDVLSAKDKILKGAPGEYTPKQVSALEAFKSQFDNSTTLDELDNLNAQMSDVLRAKNPEVYGAKFDARVRAMKGEIKNNLIQNFKNAGIKDAADAYEEYAIAKTTLKQGAGIKSLPFYEAEPVNYDKVVSNVTKNAQTVKNFKSNLDKLGKPEVFEGIKEAWLDNVIFKDLIYGVDDLSQIPKGLQTWANKWNKIRTNQKSLVSSILQPEEIRNLDVLAEASRKAMVNTAMMQQPSKTGIFSILWDMIKKRDVSPAIKMVVGENGEKARLLNRFKEAQTMKEGLTKSQIKNLGITQAGMIGRKKENE